MLQNNDKTDLLHLVESRIEALKKILVPSNGGQDEDFSESLLSANTLISNTMSGHQNTLKVAEKYSNIENYLDTNYLEKTEDTKAKQMCVKSIAPTLVATFEMLKKIKELEPTIGAEYFKSLPNVTDVIEKTNKQLRESKQSNELIEESLILAMQHYSVVQKSKIDFLKKLNENIVEIESTTKKSPN